MWWQSVCAASIAASVLLVYSAFQRNADLTTFARIAWTVTFAAFMAVVYARTGNKVPLIFGSLMIVSMALLVIMDLTRRFSKRSSKTRG